MFAEDSSSFVKGDSEQPAFEGWQSGGLSGLNCLYKSSLIGIFCKLRLSEQSQEEQFECFLELQAGCFDFGAGVWSIRRW
ncbi:hypothetical protein LBMAG46_33200 [Planctomycetia bacterium]|nr:hypothetical protein LBMAG46_33200 [Planctomycetia bacterium]